MPSETTPRAAGVQADGGSLILERRLVTGAGLVVACGLAAAATQGPLLAVASVAVAALLLSLAVLGRERMATLVMMAAFATAPMYKGLAPSPDVPITPTDLMFALGAVLLVPTLILRPLRLPLGYVVGVSLILVTGTLSTLFSPAPLISAIQFVQWLVVLVGLIVLLALWAPGWRVVDALLWSYVVGHTVSTVTLPFDEAVGDRHVGLTHHPNAFGEAGVMAFAASLYLWRRHDALWYRLMVIAGGAAGALAAVTSGSRAATVVIAGLVLMIPFVERSAVKGFALALGGALTVFLLPLLIDSTGDGNALSRLAGSADAFVADQARRDAQDFGIDLFLQHPIVGNGFADAIYVHNVVLAVAAGAGVIGLLGYLMVLFVLARPILGHHPNRRLAYVVWAFIAITPTVPGLEDRTLWVPMAPAILLAMGMRDKSDGQPLEAPAPTGSRAETVPRTATPTESH